MSPELILRLILRVVGGVMLLAFFAVIMPSAWMAASHRWLGLGELVLTPLFEYLLRSISFLYGCLGALFVLVAKDLLRYAPIVRFFGGMFMVLGVVISVVDVRVGMPLYWTLWEGPPAFLVGLLMVVLLSRVERDRRPGETV